MEFRQALALLDELSNRYLFANLGQPSYAIAGEYEPDFFADIEERIEKSFQTVNALGVIRRIKGDFALQFFYEDYIAYKEAIFEHYGLARKELIFTPASQFSLHSRQRPLQMGTYIGHLLSEFEGTLGCFVIDEDGNKFVLGCRHVLYNPIAAYEDDFIIQPGRTDGGSKADAIGLLSQSLPFSLNEINDFDAAIAGPLSEECELTYQFKATRRAVAGLGDPRQEMTVYKCGAASNITFGKISTYPTNVRLKVDNINVAFRNQMIIQGYDEMFQFGEQFTIGGDSGSLVIDFESHSGVGLLLGGTTSGLGFATPLDPVLQQLKVKILQ
jgi:hypothetical protein